MPITENSVSLHIEIKIDWTMCIIDAVKLKLKKPKPVYKVLLYDKRMKMYITPFRNVIIPEDILKGERPFTAEPSHRIPNPRRIDEGYIHSYADITETVKEYFMYYKKICKTKSNPVIFECRIDPSDEENYCWRGEFDSYPFNDCIAAKRMTFVRELTIDEINLIWLER